MEFLEQTMTSQRSNDMALGRHHTLFGENWPTEISLIASRKWINVPIKDSHYEVQSSFFSENLTDIDHFTVSVFIALSNEDRFFHWLSDNCNQLVEGKKAENWSSDHEFSHQLLAKLQMKINAIWTLPADEPGPTDHTAIHVGFIICSL